MKSLSTKSMSYDEWVKSRNRGIGGSDAGAILGFSKYKTPLAVYLEKVSGERPNVPDNPRMKAGRKLEDTVAKWWEEETGLQIRKDNKIRIHSKYPFLIGNIDRLIVQKNGKGPGILEVKTGSGFAYGDWSDGIPLSYYAQLQHYFNVTGHEWGEFAVLLDGYKFDNIPVERDDEFIDLMTEKLVGFWENNVLAGVPPEPKVESDLSLLYRSHTVGKIVKASEATYEKYLELKSVKDQIKPLEKLKESLELELKLAIGDGEAVVYNDDVLITWKSSIGFDEVRFAKENPESYQNYSKKFDLSRFKDSEPFLYEKYKSLEGGSRRFLVK